MIGVIDDHTRLAYCELHSPENAETVSATPRRAAAGMREKGSRSAQAVMSDNALCDARSQAPAVSGRRPAAHQRSRVHHLREQES